jgi:DNA polymerase III epsilon subunit-like protein
MDGHLLRFNKKAKYCFVDVETFNLFLSRENNEPWQYGLVKAEGDKIVESSEILIKWPFRKHVQCSPEAARINHYNPERIEKEGIDPYEALEKIHEMFEWADYVVGHNILGFDIYLIRDHYRYAGKDWKFLMPKILDTKAIATAIKGDYKYDGKKDNLLSFQYKLTNTPMRGMRTSLITCLKEYEIPFEEHRLHDAVYDIEKNVEVWNKMKFEIEI